MKKNEFLKNTKRTWKYIKTSKMFLIGYLCVSITEAIISTFIPLYEAKLILNLTNSILNQLIYSAICIFSLNVILHGMGFLKGFFYHKIYQKTTIGIQKNLVKEILNLEISEIEKNSSGLFIDRINKDTEDMSGLFMEYTYWFSYIISNIGVLVTIYILSKYLFIYAIITSIIIFLINKKRLNKYYKIQYKSKQINETKTGLTSELIRGMKDIKVLNANKNILNQTVNKIEESTNEEVRLLKTRGFYWFIESSIRSLFDFGFIIIGCMLYKKSLITIPTFLIVYNYQSRIKNLLTGIVQIIEFNKKFNVSANRVYEIIDNGKFKKEKFGNIDISKLNGNIKFKNVVFGYNKKKVLKNLNFEIKSNQKVAFVGKSGAGKSTLLNLITKLYTINNGEILLDDNNINDLTCSTIRDNMSIITQSPYVFNFTIKENLLLAKSDASMKEIREACKLACIDDYIMSLPNKYATIVGENGVILSGGQKQRLAIARALLMKTKIILFDEATSALDNETQSKIQEAINNLNGNYTIIIVAHRLSTIVDSDKIFVIDNGKIIDSGTHKELLKKCNHYKNLYEKDLLIDK